LASHLGIYGPGTVVVNRGEVAVPEGLEPVTIDIAAAAERGWEVVDSDLADPAADWPRHDPLKLGVALAGLVGESGR